MVRPVLHTRRRGAGQGRVRNSCARVAPACVRRLCSLDVECMLVCCNTGTSDITLESLSCRFLSDFGTAPIFPVEFPIGLKRRWLEIITTIIERDAYKSMLHRVASGPCHHRSRLGQTQTGGGFVLDGRTS